MNYRDIFVGTNFQEKVSILLIFLKISLFCSLFPFLLCFSIFHSLFPFFCSVFPFFCSVFPFFTLFFHFFALFFHFLLCFSIFPNDFLYMFSFYSLIFLIFSPLGSGKEGTWHKNGGGTFVDSGAQQTQQHSPNQRRGDSSAQFRRQPIIECSAVVAFFGRRLE